MSSPAFNLRRYGRSSSVDHHAFAQWVVPVRGELAFELEGHGARLDPLQGAFVAPMAGHAQTAGDDDRFLIVDCPAEMFDDDTLERLHRQPVLALPVQVRAMAQRVADAAHERVNDDTVRCELPGLLQAFSLAGSATRLQAVCARIERAPGQAWPVERIASEVGVSSSRLRWARGQLAASDASIADIAQHAGYSEQSALTRALRREWGMTPADYRRRFRHSQ